MRIIKEGKVPAPQVPWWTKVGFECKHCGAWFKLDENDRALLNMESERGPNGQTVLECDCPTYNCGTRIRRVMQNTECARLQHEEDKDLK